MKAKDVVAYIHQNMNLSFRPEDSVVCHASILKDWSKNDSFLAAHFSELGALRVKYDDNIKGFHDLTFSEDRFMQYIEKAEIDEEEDVYFSINSFWTIKRTENDIRHLNAFVLDYDFYKKDEYKDLSPEEMYRNNIQSSLPIKPTFVINSGRGLYCIFCIEHTPYQCTEVYKSIYRYMVASQVQFGADAKASLSTQVIRVPGSINSRSGQTVKLIEHNDIRFRISELADIFLPYSRAEVQEYKRKKLQNKSPKQISKKGIRLKSNFTSFENDLIKLIELRNSADIKSGYREVLLYLYWERAQKIEMEETAIHKKISWLNSLFVMPLCKEEILKRCRPARAYQYVTGRKKIIAKLEITEEEQKHLSFLVGVKRSAQLRQKKCRGKDKFMGRTKAAHARYERRKSILVGFSQGKKVKEMADELGVVKKTIIADCEYIQKRIQEFIDLITSLQRGLINMNKSVARNTSKQSLKGVNLPMWNFLI